MGKQIIEYKMHRTETGNLVTPPWIEDGGHFKNPTTNEMVGIVDADREYWIPDTDKEGTPGTLKQLTRAELDARMQILGMVDENGDPLDEAGITAAVTAWCDGKGVEADE